MAKKDKNTRRFSYTAPIMYQGEEFPSTLMSIADDKGNVQDRNVFADNRGRYYTMNENGMTIPVVLQHELPEVVVTAPRENMLSKQFNYYLVMSNDNTRVNNVPHRDYNSHLKDRTIKGAKANALWEKEHPNLTAWRNAVEAIPFAVAAAPFAVGAGDALAATSVGQGISSGLNMIANVAKDSTVIPWVDAAIASTFGAQGLQDVQNGKFTPETAMDLLPLSRVAKPVYKAGKSYFDLGRSLFERKPVSARLNAAGTSDENIFFDGHSSFEGFKEDPLQMHYKRAIVKGYDPSTVVIHNLSEQTEENTKLINKYAIENNLSPEQAYQEIMDFLNTHGHGAAFPGKGIVMHDGKIREPSLILSHELDHALHTPDESLPDNVFYPMIKNNYGDYFINNNNTEVAARGSQLHDYFGHTGKEPITVSDLEYARRHYVKDTGVDNMMHSFLWGIKDLKPVADWMTKYSTGIIPFGIANYNINQTNK